MNGRISVVWNRLLYLKKSFIQEQGFTLTRDLWMIYRLFEIWIYKVSMKYRLQPILEATLSIRLIWFPLPWVCAIFNEAILMIYVHDLDSGRNSIGTRRNTASWSRTTRDIFFSRRRWVFAIKTEAHESNFSYSPWPLARGQSRLQTEYYLHKLRKWILSWFLIAVFFRINTHFSDFLMRLVLMVGAVGHDMDNVSFKHKVLNNKKFLI